MNIKLILMVIFIIAVIYVSSAIQFTQVISGQGELSTKVDTKGDHVAVDTYGGQDYILYIENDKSKSRLDSVYRLKNIPISHQIYDGNNTTNTTKSTSKEKMRDIIDNYYMISMDRAGGMYHSEEIHSNGSINSNNTIKSNEKGASTTFNVSSQGGIIKESVASFDDKKHRQSMIETRTNGSMDIYSSHLVDDSKITGSFSSEVEQQSSKLESVDLLSETGRIVRPIETQEVILETSYGSISTSKDNLSEVLDVLSRRDDRPKFVMESIKQLGINEVEVKKDISADSEHPDTKIDTSEAEEDPVLTDKLITETNDSTYIIPTNIYKREIEPIFGIEHQEEKIDTYNAEKESTNDTAGNEDESVSNDKVIEITNNSIDLIPEDVYKREIETRLGTEQLDTKIDTNTSEEESIYDDKKFMATGDGIYIIESNPYKKYVAPMLNMLGGKYNTTESILVEKGGNGSISKDYELIVTEEGIYIIETGLYKRYLIPTLDMFGIKDDTNAPDENEPGITARDSQQTVSPVVIETDEFIDIIPGDVYTNKIEPLLGIEHPDTKIDAYKLGRTLQRERKTDVGRKARLDNYFQANNVTIPNSIKSQANLTTSAFNLTRLLSMSYRNHRN